jgi:hypothetical protein
VASDTRPFAFPDRTSETVDWDTPAQRATSMLVADWDAERSMSGNGVMA